MTSMFYQFEQPSLKPRTNNLSTSDLSTLGFINNALQQDDPIFKKTKKDFTPNDQIVLVALANRQLVVALANNTLFRMNLNNPQEQSEISLSKYTINTRLTNLFLDPTGNHLLLQFVSVQQQTTNKPLEGNGTELLYLSRNSTKLRSTTKFRGYECTQVAWNVENESENTTGTILLGTSKGLIFETEFVLEGDKFFTSGLEQYWRQVFDIGKGAETPITGLHYHRNATNASYLIFASTPSRLYFFTGKVNSPEKPILQPLFNRYLNISEDKTFIQVDTKIRTSKLKFYSENLQTPNSFVWMHEKGLIYCKLKDGIASMEELKESNVKIDFPRPQYEEQTTALPKLPIAVILTEFHILLGYTDKIKAICHLNKDVVYEDNYNEAFGKLVNLIKDPRTGDIWAISENAVFRFTITKEERNVWQIFAENQQFDLAKKYARSNDVYYNQVLIKEAEYLFTNKQYEMSAQRYAETQSRFEEICLKFIQVDEQDSLKILLRKKLDRLGREDKAQITMIVIWLVEWYLNKLEERRLAGFEKSSQYSEIQYEFNGFLSLDFVDDCIKKNKGTIYKLMLSHGDKANWTKLTKTNKDFEQLIRHHIHKNNFLEALDVLKSTQNSEIFYQFTPILMQEIPKATVKALIEQGKNLREIRILPALVTCETVMHAKEAIVYLKFAIDKLDNRDRAIHNFLLSLYAKFSPDELLTYIDSQGQELGMVNYDVHFALRLCQEKNLTEACVKLSALLGLYETAVDLALDTDLQLAKKLAELPPEENVELRRKLWLKIAQHVVSKENDIKKAMEFLQQCDLLRIEDILPFFSDFVTIDHFKGAICDSLQKYNQNIQDIREEMDEATKSSQEVREEIQSFRNRFTFISTQDKCDVCDGVLLIRPFYMFPCQHRFHTDCLLSELGPLLGAARKNRLADLDRQLKVLSGQGSIETASTGSGLSARDVVKAEIDNIIGAECLFCGENMIRNIDCPFIEDKQYEKIRKEWE